jgi:hypothetical protein
MTTARRPSWLWAFGAVLGLAAPLPWGRAFAEPETSDVAVDVFAGLGFGGRSLQRTTQQGLQRLSPAVFPALDLGVLVEAWPRAHWSLGISLRYQTSVFDELHEPAPNAEPIALQARSHHLELGVAPVVHLSDSPDAVALSFLAGWTLRVFWPDVHHVEVMRQVLSGPYVRPELIVPIVSALWFGIGPELDWIVTINQALRDTGVDNQGVALGGQAYLRLHLGDYRIAVSYRESHVFLGADFEDVERYGILELSRSF